MTDTNSILFSEDSTPLTESVEAKTRFTARIIFQDGKMLGYCNTQQVARKVLNKLVKHEEAEIKKKFPKDSISVMTENGVSSIHRYSAGMLYGTSTVISSFYIESIPELAIRIPQIKV